MRHKPGIIPALGAAPVSGAVQEALGTRLGAASPSVMQLNHTINSSVQGELLLITLPLTISYCTLESFGPIPEFMCE